MGRLDDRVAIVAGASWGIGAAVAEAFAGEGAKVIITVDLGWNDYRVPVDPDQQCRRR